MSLGGFLALIIVCGVVAWLGGTALATVQTSSLFSGKKSKPSRLEFRRWERMYQVRLGGGLFVLVCGSRYAFWFARSWETGNHVLRGQAILSVVFVAALIFAGIFTRRIIRGRHTPPADQLPAGEVIPTPQWVQGACRQGHAVPIPASAPGAYCQLDGDWVSYRPDLAQR